MIYQIITRRNTSFTLGDNILLPNGKSGQIDEIGYHEGAGGRTEFYTVRINGGAWIISVSDVAEDWVIKNA